MTDAYVRFKVAPRPARLRAVAGALALVAAATGVAAAGAEPAHGATGRTYVVTPTGTGLQNLEYVVEQVAQPNDVVLLADGVYRVADIRVTAPNVTIRAEHMPAATDSSPRVWLDGSIPYRWWDHPFPTVWTHSYNKDFCSTTLRGIPCDRLSVSYHADQMFQNGAPIAQTLRASDLLDTTQKWFYIAPNHQMVTNFDPGAATEVTDRETAMMFERSASGSSLQGVGVRRYAGNDHNPKALAPRQDAAVYVHDASDVAFRNVWFSFNSVRGLKTHGDVPRSQTPVAGANVIIDHSVFDHNGELGLNAVESDGIVVQHSLFYKNNFEHFLIENAGAKFLSLHKAVVVDNRFIENYGNGLWFDRSVYDVMVARNAFVSNEWHGMMYEISAKATVTSNQFVNNGHVGMLIYDSSQLSFSHNLLRGNLYGIKVQDGQRSIRNFPTGRDSDPDRKMPSGITFDVSNIDIHANGFYYAPATPTGAECNPDPGAVPSAGASDPLAGCQYMIAGQNNYAGRDSNDLGVKALNDNFHTRGWPTTVTPGVLPVYVALWKTAANVFGASGCTTAPGESFRFRWTTLSEFQCTGQEPGNRLMY